MLALPQTSTEAAASRGDVPTVADESAFSHLKPRFISRRSIPSINSSSSFLGSSVDNKTKRHFRDRHEAIDDDSEA